MVTLEQLVPNASTLSQNRRRQFAGTGVKHQLIGGRVLYTDRTHLKANYICPAGGVLRYRATTRLGYRE